MFQPESDMPSAQPREIEDPLRERTDDPAADLHSFLHAVHTSNKSNLNSLHGRGSVLFTEGEPARGVYILRTGLATVSISSSEGRFVMLGLAQAGDVLGLNSVLRGGPYDTTVKSFESCRTDFIARSELIEIMQRSHTGAQAILERLSRELAELTDRAKLLLLPQTVRGRLARLLLDWGKQNRTGRSSSVQLDRLFTHEEIAQMICSSRETVTRLMASLSKQRIIRVTSDSILIRDRLALEKLAFN
jgi:CRP/FNR family transcriptional regulator, cyclic AMP receptor protein